MKGKPISLDRAIAEQDKLARKLKREGKPLKPGTAGAEVIGLDAFIVDEGGKVTTDMLVKDKARELKQLWEQTGDVRFWNASRKLIPHLASRPPFNDERHLQRMHLLIRGGWALDEIHAANIIANELPEHQRAAFSKRVVGKYRRRFGRKPPT